MNKLHLTLLFFLLLGVAAGRTDAQNSESEDEIRELRRQIEAMQAQLASMQARLSEIDRNAVSENDTASVQESSQPSGRSDVAEPADDLSFDGSSQDQAPPSRVALDRRISSLETAAFDFPFLMAARGDVCPVNVARNFNASIGPLTGGDGIGLNATTAGKWRSRMNVNIGFYF